MQKFSDHKYFNKRRLKKFIRLIKTDDTPALIQHIADNRNYLILCSLILKLEHGSDLRILQFRQLLNAETRKQGITYDKIKNKLIPVALALGLNIDCSDAFQKDYYRILGVRPDATPPEIKTAYRKKAGIVHPDKPSGKKDDFIAIQEAYSVLGDDSIRHQYDISCKQVSFPVWSETAESEPELNALPGKISRYAYYLIVLVLCLLCISFIIDMVYQEFSLDDHVETANNRNVDHSSNFKHVTSSHPEGLGDEFKNFVKVSSLLPGFDKSEVEKNDNKGINNNVGHTDGQPGSNKKNVRINYSKESENRIAALESKYYSNYNRVKVSGPSKEINNRKMKVQGKIDTSVQREKPFIIISGPANDAKHGKPSDLSGQRDETAGIIAAQQPVNRSERLNDFIRRYCSTYESKNIDEFIKFFTVNALENGKPIKSLLSKYQQNFQMLEKIDYKIDIKNYLFDLDLNKVRLEGDFNLKWQKKKEDIWKNYKGTIQMELINDEKQVFLVERLQYSFQFPKD